MNREKFIANLIANRKAHGLTQKQVAEFLGISNRTYSKWETGETEPGIELLCHLAELYHFTPAAFFADRQNQPMLREELAALPVAEAAQLCFQWTNEMYAGIKESSSRSHELQEPVTPPSEPEAPVNDFSEYRGGALFLRHQGIDANVYLQLMPSKEGYSWLTSESKEIAAFFSLLRNPRLLEPLLEFETDGRWNCWTPAYLAEKADLSPEDALNALEAFERWGLCSRENARTTGGDTLFMGGETRLLRAILTLAHILVSPMANEGGEEG